jgi:hypothetical protein
MNIYLTTFEIIRNEFKLSSNGSISIRNPVKMRQAILSVEIEKRWFELSLLRLHSVRLG